jgi:hypothetical protein
VDTNILRGSRPKVAETKDGQDYHPHACYEGVVYLTYTVFDEAIGDEVEKIEAVPWRRRVEEERA